MIEKLVGIIIMSESGSEGFFLSLIRKSYKMIINKSDEYKIIIYI